MALAGARRVGISGGRVTRSAIMRSPVSTAVAWLPLLFLGGGCGTAVDADISPLRASAALGDLTVTLDEGSRWEVRDGRRLLVLRGTSNRDLDGVFSFVPDDPFGRAELLRAR